MKYLYCTRCGADVRVSEEAIGAICWRCFMCAGHVESQKADLPITDNYSVGDIIEMLEKRTISKLREKLGISVRDMAKKLGLSKSLYFRCENSRKIPPQIIANIKENLELELQNNDPKVGQAMV